MTAQEGPPGKAGRVERAIRVAGWRAEPDSIQARWIERISGVLAQAKADGFVDPPEDRRYKETYREISVINGKLVTFSEEDQDRLEAEGRVILPLTGKSIHELASLRRYPIRRFSSTWHRNVPDLETLVAKPTEVAIPRDPENFFHGESASMTIAEATSLIGKLNDGLPPSVRHIVFRKPSLLVELAFELEELEDVRVMEETAGLTGYETIFGTTIYVAHPEEGMFLGYRAGRWPIMVPNIIVPADYQE